MTEIIPEFPPYKVMGTVKKGVSGGVVASIALGILSCFHGLTPEQSQAATIVLVAVVEGVRNLFKKKFPSWFSWL